MIFELVCCNNMSCGWQRRLVSFTQKISVNRVSIKLYAVFCFVFVIVVIGMWYLVLALGDKSTSMLLELPHCVIQS